MSYYKLEVHPDYSAVATAEKRDVSDEARDEGGKWTADGGDWRSNSIADDGSVKLDTVLGGYSNEHPETNISGLRGIDPDAALSTLSQLSRLQEQFPSVKLRDIGLNPRLPATAAAAYGDGTISLNPKFYGTDATMPLYANDNGFHPDGTSNATGYITHEFGHAVDDRMMQLAMSLDPSYKGAGAAVQKWIRGDFRDSDPVSGYARTGGVTEKFAELFSGAMTKGSDVYSTPMADSLRSMLTDTGIWKGTP